MCIFNILKFCFLRVHFGFINKTVVIFWDEFVSSVQPNNLYVCVRDFLKTITSK